MSHSEPGLVTAVLDWIEESVPEQLDEMAKAYDSEANIPLRGQSIRLSLSDLKTECEVGEIIVDGLISAESSTSRGSAVLAIREAIEERADVEVGEPMDDGWSVEWVDPTEEMEIDIGDPLSRHTGQLVSVDGRVRQLTDPLPWFRIRTHRCQRCLESQGKIIHRPEDVVRGIVRTPYSCRDETCPAGQDDFLLTPSDSDKRDYQYLEIEQAPDTDGSQPSKIPCWVFGEGRLTNAASGEGVTITGRLRLNPDAEPVKHYLEVSTVECDREDDTVEVTEDDRGRVNEMVGKMDDPLAEAADSICPEIHGQMLAKMGLVLATVGSGIDDTDENTHTMLIGDPGTGKTRLARAVREIYPSARQVSATSSSDVGLTASAVKESVAGNEEWVIRAGALSLASGGVLTIDELDKSDFSVSTLNEPLSEGELSVAKAGEKVTVKTDTRVVATANPDGSTFDPDEELDDQIGFDASVVNRFDLVFPFCDDGSDEARNRGIARASASRYLDDEEIAEEYEAYTRDIDLETLRKWVKIAQQQDVRMTVEAMKEIEEGWMLLRQPDGGVISINARRLDAVARLARAHARLRLGEEVTEGDAKEAFRLVSAMLGEWGYDITGGSDGDAEEVDGDVSISDRERENVAEMARNTDKSAEEIREEVMIPESAGDEVERIVEDERDESIAETLSRPQTELSHTRGESRD